jgi:hypothetical protein
MIDWHLILPLLTGGLLAAGGYALNLLRTGSEAFVKTTAEEAAKTAIEKLKWPAELGRELQKTRGVERQELRFKSYGALWKELRPLAIYDVATIDKKVVGDMLPKLSDWYFSDCGGLLLTPQARDFYFALQDLLRALSSSPDDWEVVRPQESGENEKDLFKAVMRAKSTAAAISAFEYIKSDALDEWQAKAPGHADSWRKGVNSIADKWGELDNAQRFVTLQQVGSVLRTSLANDLESRLR